MSRDYTTKLGREIRVLEVQISRFRDKYREAEKVSDLLAVRMPDVDGRGAPGLQ